MQDKKDDDLIEKDNINMNQSLQEEIKFDTAVLSQKDQNKFNRESNERKIKA